MRIRNLGIALIALTLAVESCSDGADVLRPISAVSPVNSVSTDAAAGLLTDASLAPRINEIHYDNAGTDSGEQIEISGPVGMSIAQWSIVLYNGNGSMTYDTRILTEVLPATCEVDGVGRGVVVATYSVNGIQNGNPDGIALVNAAGQVVEFLSYGGTITAANGPAAGQTSTDIGITEGSGTPIGHSLERNGDGGWSAGPNSFRSCNTNEFPTAVASVTVSPAAATIVRGSSQQFTATAYDASGEPLPNVTLSWQSSAPTIAQVNTSGVATGLLPGDTEISASAANGVSAKATLHIDEAPPKDLPLTRFSELHYDNAGTDAGESIEIEGPAGTDLARWRVVLYNGNGGTFYNTRTLTGSIPANCGTRGVIVLSYPQDGIQNGSPDGLALVNAEDQVVEFLSYEGTFTAVGGPANGLTSVDIGVSQASTPLGQSLQRNALGVWEGPSVLLGSSLGGCNGGPPPPPPGKTITFSGRLVNDPPLPVGFQDQLFATLRDGNGAVVPTTFTWSSETPSIAAMDQLGVMTAVGAGTATVRATAADGTTATFSLPTHLATTSTTAQYAGNAEFGEPSDGDASDDFIVRHAQYTTSYSQTRGTPNWVSYNLEATHFGPEDRCDCFTFDPSLPAAFERYTTADYTGAGAFHGYGIDRGHLARSADRTAASLDNAFTYYFTNIIPQAADNNQGPWAAMENRLGDRARDPNTEVYVIAGVAGSKGTVKNEGKISIPAHVWKVAVIMPRNQGLANVDSYDDIEVIAVTMPNNPGIRNVNWETYKTTVDAVEALSGYNLLHLLPDQIEIAVESNTKPPVARLDGPYVSLEGSEVMMSAASSTDPDSDPLSYRWDLGDGTTKHGAIISHAYAQDGTYDVRLTVTDPLGLVATTSTTTAVSNVAPIISTFSGATLLPGETYTAIGSFTDPGADRWTAVVDYGDGAGQRPLVLVGKTYSLSHTYATPGAFTVTVRISDDDVTTTRTQSVVIQTPARGAENIIDAVDHLARSGALDGGNANALTSKLSGAVKQLEAQKIIPAVNQLESFINQVGALERSDRLSTAQATPLRSSAQRVIRSVSP
jgi:DNA/RNA endonuclease G (NUC1)